MRKNVLLFLILILFVACQQDNLITENTVLSSEQQVFQFERPSYQNDLHPSILNSDWWQGLDPINQQLVGMELAQDGTPLTMAEFEDRKRQAMNQALNRAGACPGYPANPAGDVTLNSQADVNAFGALKCKEIIGALNVTDTLGPDPICDLSPLKGLKSVGSNMTISADCLTSLSGLEKLKSVGKLGPLGFTGIIGAGLTDIEALKKLSVVTGSINIINCDMLTSVTSAFSNITEIDTSTTTAPITSVYVLNINDNELLTDLSAFSGLTHIEGGLRILSNASLLNLDDLSGLNSVGNDIFILENTSLQQVNELSNINTILDDLYVFDNPSLTQCCGLYSLLCSDPPVCSGNGVGDIIAIFNNGAGCTEADIIANGPCL
jgi:hypothetical protein